MQLYEQLRRDITGGVLLFGDKLPSKRLLAEETGAGVITVEHAYALLEEEGYLEARQRSGYFVIYTEADSLPERTGPEPAAPAKHQERPASGNSLSERDPEEFSFSVYARTMRRVLLDYSERILEPSPGAGCAELRQALASYLLRSRGMNVSPDQILIGAGAEYLYTMAVRILGRDKKYAIEDPSYNKIRLVYEAEGVSVEALELGPDGIVSSRLRACTADVLHVTPFTSYPSGITATASKRKEYIRWALERDAYVIEDDYNSEFSISTKAEDTLFLLEPDRHVIYMNTFSRTISPSVRIGYMVLPNERYREMLEKNSFYACTVPVFEQLVLARFIEDGDFERHINRVRRKRRRR
ncbi:MAG: PLP-dependent aminotransferase family protein [Lachnospiraceae bacterium]|nr:PLP-dependent aminotransferase family protein [Lachnospiraceae bacterium]